MHKNKLFFIITFLNIILFNLFTFENTNDVELDKMIGQMLLIGFRGTELSSDSNIIKDIKEYNIGGVVLFDYDLCQKNFNRNIKNPEQLKILISNLKNHTEIPLFIGIDQEGGKVNRLKEKYGFPQTYSSWYLGNLNNLDFTKQESCKIGKMLYELGINLNFAPVVDINMNPDNPVIAKYERSYSENEKIVANHAEAFIDGLVTNKIFPCIKHFPGHGSSKDDSHKDLTDITNTWKEIELYPYEELIKQNKIEFIMAGHLFNKNLDDKYPATLSYKILKELLRDKMRYQGIIISDDMQMKAITKYYGLKRSIYLAINAGIDILIYGNNLEYDPEIAGKIFNVIKDLVKENKISYSRIKESYDRIIKIKKNLK